MNKVDLGEHESWKGREAVRISCRDRTGLEALEEAIERKLLGHESTTAADALAINVRHEAALRQALEFTQKAEEGLASATPPEFIAEELRAAIDAVGEIVGRTETEDLLGKIFQTFCIGK